MAQIGDAWVNAVAALDCPESRNLLLGFVDPDLPGLPVGPENSIIAKSQVES